MKHPSVIQGWVPATCCLTGGVNSLLVTTTCFVLSLFILGGSSLRATGVGAATTNEPAKSAPTLAAGEAGVAVSKPSMTSQLPADDSTKLPVVVRVVKVGIQPADSEPIQIGGLWFRSILGTPLAASSPILSSSGGQATPGSPLAPDPKSAFPKRLAPRPFILTYLGHEFKANFYGTLNSGKVARVLGIAWNKLAHGEPGVGNCPNTRHITLPSLYSSNQGPGATQPTPKFVVSSWYVDMLAHRTPEGGVLLKVTIHDPGRLPVSSHAAPDDQTTGSIVVPAMDVESGLSFVVAVPDEYPPVWLPDLGAGSPAISLLGPPRHPGDAVALYFITVNPTLNGVPLIPH